MKERPTFTVKILQRFYTELIIRGFEPETECLYLPKPVEDDETEDKEAKDVVNEPSKLQLALEKIRHALNSRMRPNINAFQGQPLSVKEFQKLLMQEIRVRLIGEELRECFKYFDMDNSGTVDFKEMIHKIYHKERLSIKKKKMRRKKVEGITLQRRNKSILFLRKVEVH